MANRASITFKGDLFGNIDQMDAKIRGAMAASGKLMEQEGVAYMRSNAPWQDQTGNARNGLSGSTEVSGDSVSVVYFHQVPYGIWLEVANSGRYQIIAPTIQVMGPRWFNLLRSMIFKGV